MPYCPECGTEYREGFTTCRDCDVALTDTPPPADTQDEPEEEEWTPVYTGRGVLLDVLDERLKALEIRTVRTAFEQGGSEAVFGTQTSIYTLLVPKEVHQERREEIEEVVASANREYQESGTAATEAEQDYDVRGCLECGLYFHDVFEVCPGCEAPLVPAVELFSDDQLEPDRVIVAAGLDLPMKDLAERLQKAGFDAEAFSVEEWLVAAVDVPWGELTGRTEELEPLLPAKAGKPGGGAI